MAYFGGYPGRAAIIQEVRSDPDVHALCTVGNILWFIFGKHIHCNIMSKVSGGDWGYKPLSEASSPVYYSCPLKYLDMVPEENPEWRQKVREYHANARRKLEIGHWYEYSGDRIVQITVLQPVLGRIDGELYRLSRQNIGACLTA